MLSGLSSYLFGGPSEEGHPAATTQSATALAEAAASASERSPRLKTTSTDDDWTIVDPASRGNSPLRLEDNPMENLLIEHPSMSVYQHRGRPNSRGTDEDSSSEGESDSDMDTAQAVDNTRPAGHVNGRPGSRTARLAAGLSAAVAMKSKKSAQAALKRKEARQVSRRNLDRNNKVQKFNSSAKIPRRKQQMFRVNSGRNNDRKCHH